MSIRGKPAPIIGRVCMDQTLVDVTDIPDVKMNDEVTVFGPENAAIGADTADSIAAKTGTINYEIICGISRRVPVFTCGTARRCVSGTIWRKPDGTRQYSQLLYHCPH